ncbi:DNA mismatch repair endonuclease MutL [Peptoniphilus sp. KCTC 25270]|uniref:DNA mismatch repair endonuclease MutL n=1 Tax=Peptoniphilus sp. KCTC 25270 TaxID=2897414 RepID=UPI001E39E75F|nr:DNA mismatch repair endonuclease MutL [Peptoniphilus sp. KCTC 25270]MCD1147012.1 DNA mismatch repair endonuclease MutL [Peptoniphilus sp. KCTC 25270]
MRKIKPLSNQTISQIAAGEIIDSPASVCKELVENAIDAKATKILIQIGDEITDSIRITDNGIGISKEDIPMAFRRHATSKLEKIEDFEDLFTLGFRGEALASIASVSQVELITKTEEETIGTKVDVINGEVDQILPIGSPQGTSILVKNLFYNTPVRKKYLRSTRKELESILDLVESIALGHDEISFHLIYKSKTLLHSHPSKNKKNHLFSLLGKDYAENMLPISFQSESYKVDGFISNNSIHRSRPDKEYIFVNGRKVKSIEISKAIRSVYHTLIPLNRYPVFVLYLTIDPVLVDVNVHPQKQYVRLSNENYITDILEKLVRGVLFPHRIVPETKFYNERKEAPKEETVVRETIFDLAKAKKEESEKKIQAYEEEKEIKEEIEQESEDRISEKEPVEVHEESIAFQKIKNYDPGIFVESMDLSIDSMDFVGVLFKTYIIFEDKKNKKALFMDQHAAHERILFEKFYKELSEKRIEKQVLLEPIRLSLSRTEKMKLMGNLSYFDSLGFTLEWFGEEDVLLREVPYSVLVLDYNSFLRDAIAEIEEGTNVAEKNIYKIMRMACRKAIKAGDEMNSLTAMNLLKELLEMDTPYSCPHGRPTMIEMTNQSFEKMFLREV